MVSIDVIIREDNETTSDGINGAIGVGIFWFIFDVSLWYLKLFIRYFFMEFIFSFI